MNIETIDFDKVFKDFQGVDIFIEESLLEYGLIWTDRGCEEGELFFIVKVDEDSYERGYVSHDRLDFVEDTEEFFKYLGETKEEWLDRDLGQKVYDVVGYFGAHELFYSYCGTATTLEDLIKLYSNEE